MTMAFCSKCGNKLDEGTVFCPSCGNKVGVDSNAQPSATVQKEIQGNITPIQSKIPLELAQGEFPIAQYSAACVMSTIAQGTFTLTNRRILFKKDSVGKSILKGGGLLGGALRAGANVPDEISLADITGVEPTSCVQGKAALILVGRSGYQYKYALQSMNLAKTKELCDARDRIVSLISSAL
jgi:uncharacterized Zn finger protein (UPF0148 family)